jgi:hypothetical protein
MNIDEYRALKAQEDSQKPEGGEQPNAQVDESPVTTTETAHTETKQEEPTPTPEGKETDTQTEPSQPQVPEFIEINGEQVNLDELKNGYLRQSDYTQKTQQLAEQRRKLQVAEELMKQINADPEKAKALAEQTQIQALDPAVQKQLLTEQELWDLRLENEIRTLETKYPDFNKQGVLELAYEKETKTLEDAYLLYKALNPTTQVEPKTETPSVDAESLKAQLRAELLAELKAEQVDTGSIISTRSGSAPQTDNSPKLTDAEKKIASIYGMTDAEYAKWRDNK